MLRFPVRAIILLLLPLAGMLAACSGEGEADKGPLVLAASSMQESLQSVSDEWTRQGHRAPVVSFASSSALARQIERGAPADLFISADEEWMDALAGQRLLRPGSRAVLLGNSLVLVAPARSTVEVDFADPASFSAALGEGPLAIADPAAVPAGKYGKAALESLKLWGLAEGRLAPAENVRAALALVERGEASLGIVYATDAMAARDVRMVASFPASSHPPIRYPAAVLAASTHEDAAAFRAFLTSATARAIFARYGFVAPD